MDPPAPDVPNQASAAITADDVGAALQRIRRHAALEDDLFTDPEGALQ